MQPPAASRPKCQMACLSGRVRLLCGDFKSRTSTGISLMQHSYLSAREGGELLRLDALWGIFRLLFPSTVLLAQLCLSFFLFLNSLTPLSCCNQDWLGLPRAFDIWQLNCAQFLLCIHFMSKQILHIWSIIFVLNWNIILFSKTVPQNVYKSIFDIHVILRVDLFFKDVCMFVECLSLIPYVSNSINSCMIPSSRSRCTPESWYQETVARLEYEKYWHVSWIISQGPPDFPYGGRNLHKCL